MHLRLVLTQEEGQREEANLDEAARLNHPNLATPQQLSQVTCNLARGPASRRTEVKREFGRLELPGFSGHLAA